jgi:hypothetical protein
MNDKIDLRAVADILNVPIEYVDRLFIEGKIHCTGSGDQRLFDAGHVLKFKEQRDSERRQGLRELVRMTQEFGGYGDDECPSPPIQK